MKEPKEASTQSFFDASRLKHLCVIASKRAQWMEEDDELDRSHHHWLQRQRQHGSSNRRVVVDSCRSGGVMDIGSLLREEIDLDHLRNVIQKWCGEEIRYNSSHEQGPVEVKVVPTSLDSSVGDATGDYYYYYYYYYRESHSTIGLSAADCRKDHFEANPDEIIKIMARRELATLASRLSAVNSRGGTSFHDSMRSLERSFQCTSNQSPLPLKDQNIFSRPIITSSSDVDGMNNGIGNKQLSRCTLLGLGSLMVDEAKDPSTNRLEVHVEMNTNLPLKTIPEKYETKEKGIFFSKKRLHQCLLSLVFCLVILSYLNDDSAFGTTAPEKDPPLDTKEKISSTALTTYSLNNNLSMDFLCASVPRQRMLAFSKNDPHTHNNETTIRSLSSNALGVFIARSASPSTSTTENTKEKNITLLLLLKANKFADNDVDEWSYEKLVHPCYDHHRNRCSAKRSPRDPRPFSELLELHTKLFDLKHTTSSAPNEWLSNQMIRMHHDTVTVRRSNSTLIRSKANETPFEITSSTTKVLVATNAPYRALPGWLRPTVPRIQTIYIPINETLT